MQLIGDYWKRRNMETPMKATHTQNLLATALACALAFVSTVAFATDAKKPNIVFILVDNIGWGDLSVYGGTTTTPRIDALANSGIRFNNYNVEGQCTPSRSAIMTGRQSVRSGTFSVPIDPHLPYGLAPWEYTIAKLLSDSGYATALFGKWHLGSVEGRLPTNQGFDEWWGYKDSMDEAGWTSYALYREMIKGTHGESPKIWEGKKGEPLNGGLIRRDGRQIGLGHPPIFAVKALALAR